MGTKLVYSVALLLATVSSISVSATTSSTTPASTLIPAEEASASLKSKRGVVNIGTNNWPTNGSFQPKSTNPGTSSATVNQNSGSHSPQRSSSSSSPTYSAAQNDGRTSVYNNPNFGYQQTSPFVNLNFGNADESYGNDGSSYGTNGPNYGSTGQSYVSSPQNYGSINHGQNSGFPSYYSQTQSTGSQSSPNFASFDDAQPLTSSAELQNSQGSQIRNGAISTPYFANFDSVPSSVKIFTNKLPTGQYRVNLGQIPSGQQASHKTQSMYAPNHQSGSYNIPNIGSYSFQPTASLRQGSHYASQGGPVFAATSQIQRNTPKTDFSGQKNAELGQMYAPRHQSASSFVPTIQGNVFSPATVNFEGKKIPLPVLQLQSAEDFPGFTQSINAEPLVLETNAPFQTQSEFGFLADFAKTLTPQAGNILPFLNTQQSNQPQVLPVKSANGSPEFPQFKGARINTSPNYNLGKPTPSYQPLNAQPQLHFTGKPALPAPVPAPLSTSSIIHHPLLSTRPVAEIRDDVEIIKKKKPAPPPTDFDDDELDEGYKAIEREYGRQQDDAEDDIPHRGKYFKESDGESDLKPSKGYPFKSYDEQFSKYSKPSSDEESDEDRPASRYRYLSSSDDDGDYDGHSSTQHADYRSPQDRPSRYEDSGEESQRHERQDEDEEDEEHGKQSSAYKSYDNDFEQEFENSYRRELPKTKYVHIKEVPEIDETSASTYKSYSSSDSPQKSSKQDYRGRTGYHQSHDEEPEESKGYSSHTSHKYGKLPKSRDSEGYDSNIRSYHNGPSPKVVHEESFGYKTPDANSYSKYKKSPTGDSYSSIKKSPKTDSYLQASRSSYKSPKNDKAYENGDSYSYSSGSTWKSDSKTPETSDSHGHSTSVVKTLAVPESTSSFHAPSVGVGKYFLSHNGKIERDLTGI